MTLMSLVIAVVAAIIALKLLKGLFKIVFLAIAVYFIFNFVTSLGVL